MRVALGLASDRACDPRRMDLAASSWGQSRRSDAGSEPAYYLHVELEEAMGQMEQAPDTLMDDVEHEEDPEMRKRFCQWFVH